MTTDPANGFDARLKSLWDDREARGAIQYPIRDLRRRAAGRLRVQCNPARVQKEEHARRPLRDETPVVQPFGTTDDFLRIRRRAPLQWLFEERVGGRTLAFHVNYAPVLRHHFLLIPDPGARLPQVLDERAFEAAFDALELSAAPELYLGFNSLGCWASINHLHFQGVYYPEGRMGVSRMPRRVLGEGPDCRLERVLEYPLGCGVLSGGGRAALARTAAALVRRLLRANVAHTLLVTHGEVYVFPRGRGRGRLVPTGAGFFESGGEIFVGEPALYERVTEGELRDELEACALPAEEQEPLFAAWIADLEAAGPPAR